MSYLIKKNLNFITIYYKLKSKYKLNLKSKSK